MEYMYQAESVMYHPGNVLSGECYVAGSLSSKNVEFIRQCVEWKVLCVKVEFTNNVSKMLWLKVKSGIYQAMCQAERVMSQNEKWNLSSNV